MVDFSFPIDGFISILDYLGTIAFAVTGASKAIAHKADIFGILVLATVVGVAGGITRDIIFGRFPTAFSDPTYVSLTVITGIVMFFLYSYFKKRMNVWLVFDAIGLGVFSIIGASIAYQIVGLDFLSMLFAGVITAIGGGILRDIFVRDIPIVFVKEVYAVASIIGIVIFYTILSYGVDMQVASIIGIVAATGIRLLAMKYKWNLPRVKDSTD
ncbi:trimeric intracellular cation channel family protein [Marine Group I thaumarchaeote]|uniref:Trimeric intracellular cation channel family protein n=1 Tax=Marine Group I thaumarchaeote TaxID=2511932 RepID=A0A7K4N6V3_9ARCH|nr:trimeric intracellular cation channel family protein [Marine Group I thaumarchaeote]NWK08027.1 trimeric intracellular cation channel family protein [Marine Group I thaumarchaeote]NWK14107.1 trimeric intracellular cation channel family protein [Marine Group I thaumarchaeote]